MRLSIQVLESHREISHQLLCDALANWECEDARMTGLLLFVFYYNHVVVS